MSKPVANGRIHRRSVLRGGSLGALGVLSASLLGCSADDADDSDASPTSTSGQSTGTGGVTPGGTLRLAISYDVNNYDPIRTNEFTANRFADFVYSKVFKFAVGEGEFASGAVEGDAISEVEQPDELTYLLRLREGMTWDERAPTSGRDLTARDVVASWEVFKDGSAYRTDLVHDLNPQAPIVSLEEIDDSTIEIKTAFPDAQLLPTMAHYLSGLWVMPEEAFSGAFDPSSESRGSGAWILEKHNPSVGFEFKRNPNWYGGPEQPYVDRINLSILTDAAQGESQFRSRNIHLGGIPQQNLLIASRELEGSRVDLSAPAANGPAIQFSSRPGSPHRDVRVRRALAMLIDRDAFIETYYELSDLQDAGLNATGYWSSPIGAGYGPYWLDPRGNDFGSAAQYLEYNVPEARKLLEAAGYPELELDYTFNAGSHYGTNWESQQEFVTSMLSAGGVRVRSRPIDYTTEFIPNWLRAKGDWDENAVCPNINGGRGDVGQWLSVFLSSAGANNQVSTHYPELDALIEAQRQEFDLDARVAKVHEVQRYCVENMVTLPYGGSVEAMSISWSGLHGPDTLFSWPGSGNPATEVYPSYWLEPALQG